MSPRVVVADHASTFRGQMVDGLHCGLAMWPGSQNMFLETVASSFGAMFPVLRQVDECS